MEIEKCYLRSWLPFDEIFKQAVPIAFIVYDCIQWHPTLSIIFT